MPQNAQIQLRRDTAANWTSVNPVLAIGEVGLETDTRKAKFGDGSTAWTGLSYAFGGAAASWGSITGTLSDQTDLQAALDAKMPKSGGTFTSDILVPDEAYGAPWDGSLEVPTKNALYDKIETIVAAAGGASVDMFEYNFSASTSAPPGANQVRLNHATMASVTRIWCDNLTNSGFDPTNFFLATTTNDVIGVQDKNDSSIFHRFTVTATPTIVSSDYIEIQVTHLSGAGTFNGGQPTCVAIIQPTPITSITLTGDVTGTGSSSIATTISNNAVSLAKMADMATASVIYRKTAGTGDPEVQTLATLKTDLGLTGTNSGDQTSIVGITGTLAQFNTAITDADIMPIAGGTFTGLVTTVASATGSAGFNLPHGAAPTTPANGDIWTQTTGIFVRINGTTRQLIYSTSISDTAYGVSWDGAATVAPSQNAVYDKIEAVITTIPAAPSTVISDTAYGAGWNGVTTIAPSKNALYDEIELRMPKAGGTFTGDISVPTEAYGAGWSSSAEAPTKGDLYTKIEAITVGGGGVTSFNTRSGAVTLTSTDVNTALGYTAADNASLSNYIPLSQKGALNGVGSLDSGGRLNTSQMPALTGDVTTSVGTVATTIGAGKVTLAMQANVNSGTVFYRKTAAAGAPEVQTLATLKTDLGLTGTNSGDQTITLTGDVTGSGTGSFAATIAANAVTNADLADVATATIKGRVTASTGDPEDLTGTQATTLLDTFTSSLKGLAPSSGGGTTNFLRADGTWAAPGGGTTTNSITWNNSGSGAASGATFNGSAAVTVSYNTIGAAASGAVTASGLTMATARVLGRTTASTGAIEEISIGGNLTLSAGSLNLSTTAALATGVTGVTQSEGDNSTKLATTAYVDRLKGLVDNSGGAVTLAIGHRGELYRATGNVTCPNAVFAAGDVIRVYNNSASSISIVQGTSVTMRLVGTATTGTRTLAQRGVADILYVASNECVVSGVT